MKYTIYLVWHETIDIEANNRIDALEKAKTVYPNHTPDYIGTDEGNEPSSCINICDDCGAFIFDDDESATDPEDGITLCGKCIPLREYWELTDEDEN